MRAAIVLVVGAGCGRVDFDPAADASVSMSVSIGGNASDVQGSTTADTGISECEPTLEFGGSSHVHVKEGTTCPDSREVALLRFDLSAVPAKARVTSAVFRIWTHNATALVATVEMHRVLEAWDEGVTPDPGAPGAANWTERRPGVPWTAAGCGNGSCDPAVIGSFATLAGPDHQLEGALDVSVVQGWVDGTYENNGLALKAPGADTASSAALESRSGVDGQRPELVLSYLP